MVILFLFAELWCHTKWTTELESLLVSFRVVLGREAEVSQFDDDLAIIFLLAKQVFWLQIAMHNVLAVHVVESEQDLLDDVCGVALRESTPAAVNHFKQVSTGDKLHDDVEAAIIFHQLKDTSDVRMHCLFKDCKLILVQLLENFV